MAGAALVADTDEATPTPVPQSVGAGVPIAMVLLAGQRPPEAAPEDGSAAKLSGVEDQRAAEVASVRSLQ